MFTLKQTIEERVPAWEECECVGSGYTFQCGGCQGSGGKWHEAVSNAHSRIKWPDGEPVRYLMVGGIGINRVTKSSTLVREWECGAVLPLRLGLHMNMDTGNVEPCDKCTASPWRVE